MSVFPEGTIERRIEEILTKHRSGERIRQECRCGTHPGHLTLAEHQAEALMDELGLTQVWSDDIAGPQWQQYSYWRTPTDSHPGPMRIAAGLT